MNVTRLADGSLGVDLADGAELEATWASSLSAGGLLLPGIVGLAPFTPLRLVLRVGQGPAVTLSAKAVAPLPGATAVQVDGNPREVLAALRPAEPASGNETIWDRLRALSHLERLMLAPKADRQERAILVQDSDGQVLLALLRNPRVTIDEVIRVAKSPFLTYQIVELVLKTPQWGSSVDLKAALVHNARTPPTFSTRLLPFLSEADLRTVARAGTSQTLKQAALRLLQQR